MFVSKTALVVIEVREPVEHRPNWSNDDRRVVPDRPQGFVDRVKARDIPETSMASVWPSC